MFGLVKGVSKSVQVLFHGTEAVMALTGIILNRSEITSPVEFNQSFVSISGPCLKSHRLAVDFAAINQNDK